MSISLLLLLLAPLASPVEAPPADPIAAEAGAPATDATETAASEAANYLPMRLDAARTATLAWAATVPGTGDRTAVVTPLWETADAGLSGRMLHQLVVQSFILADPAVQNVFNGLDHRTPSLVPPDVAAVADRSADAFFGTNLRLSAAQFLTDARMYEEALELFAAADLGHAVDPASALFYRAVCEHQLLLKDEGLATLASLADRTAEVPESYTAVARLMQADLEAIEPDSLDEVAKMMRDVERRLELARGGKRVQKKEDEIIGKLDDVIQKIEQQMSKGKGPGSPGNTNNPNNPAQESTVKGAPGEGEVDHKTVRRQGGWGDLPPRERDAAKAEIEKNFPAGYNRLIEEYFLKRSQARDAAGQK